MINSILKEITLTCAFELIALCREVKFGTRQIDNMLILYQPVFLSGLIYNCESWSHTTQKDYKALQSTQLFYLRNVLEVSMASPTAALFLELGILPVRFEIENRQLFSLKRLLDQEKNDPVQNLYTLSSCSKKLKRIGLTTSKT